MRGMKRFTCLTLSLLALSTGARAETAECAEITSVPAFILHPGVYCLKKSLAFTSATGQAIHINTDDVVIDLNGHVLDNSSTGTATSAVGINGRNLRNVSLRNGTIRGFRTCVQLTGVGNQSRAYLVEHLLLDRNTATGMDVRGQGSVIRNNRIVDTGGSTLPNVLNAWGLAVGGAGVHVIGNEVIGTLEQVGGQAFGIQVDLASGGVVERNIVSGPAFGPSASFGITISRATHALTVAAIASRT